MFLKRLDRFFARSKENGIVLKIFMISMNMELDDQHEHGIWWSAWALILMISMNSDTCDQHEHRSNCPNIYNTQLGIAGFDLKPLTCIGYPLMYPIVLLIGIRVTRFGKVLPLWPNFSSLKYLVKFSTFWGKKNSTDKFSFLWKAEICSINMAIWSLKVLKLEKATRASTLMRPSSTMASTAKQWRMGRTPLSLMRWSATT